MLLILYSVVLVTGGQMSMEYCGIELAAFNVVLCSNLVFVI